MGKTYTAGETLFAADLNSSLSEAVNTTGFFIFTGNHVYSSNLTLNKNTTSNGVFTFNANAHLYANLYSSSNLIDKIGEVRLVPLIPSSGSVAGRTLDATDHGKCVVTTSTVTVPSGVFSSGQNVTIYNRSDVSISVNADVGLTLYNSSQGTTGNRTLAKRGLCSILFITNSEALITGAGVT